MDDTNRHVLEQALHDMRSRTQNTHDPVQSGAQPEQRMSPPNPYSSEARVFSPAPSISNVQSQAQAYKTSTPPMSDVQSQAPPLTTQAAHPRSTVFLPNGLGSYDATSASQGPMMQHRYQPAQQQQHQQQQLGSRLGFSPSVNNTYQNRRDAPQGRLDRGSYQSRYQPYGVPSSRTPHGSSSRHSQNVSQAPLPTDSTSSYSRFYETSQAHLPATPQVRTAEDQNRIYRLYELQARQHQVPSPASLPQGVMYSPRGPSFQIPQTTQSVSTEGLSSSRTQDQSSVQSYGRIQTPTQSTQRAPPQSITLQSVPQAPIQSTPYAPTQSKTHASTQSTSQIPLFKVSTPLHPAQASPQSSPSPPRVWLPQLQTVMYSPLSLQTQPDSEANHPDQKELVDAMQKRLPEKLRPHEFVDYLTIEHNASSKFGVHRVYDILFMQALLFANNEVLLVSPRNLQCPCWELPQNVWHADDMSGKSPHYRIISHMFKALNMVSDLQPNEVALCADHPRHDSAVNIAKPNGGLIPGWAVAVSCEIRSDFPGLRPRNCYQQYHARFFSKNHVKILNMDPVWKAKVLDIFQLRRNAKIANREDSMMNR